VMGMDHMVRTMAAGTTASLPEVIRMASLTPAQRVGIEDRVGSLETGKLADVLLLTADLKIDRVFLGGEEFRLGC